MGAPECEEMEKAILTGRTVKSAVALEAVQGLRSEGWGFLTEGWKSLTITITLQGSTMKPADMPPRRRHNALSPSSPLDVVFDGRSTFSSGLQPFTAA